MNYFFLLFILFILTFIQIVLSYSHIKVLGLIIPILVFLYVSVILAPIIVSSVMNSTFSFFRLKRFMMLTVLHYIPVFYYVLIYICATKYKIKKCNKD